MTAHLGRDGEYNISSCPLIDAMLRHRRSDRCDSNAGTERNANPFTITSLEVQQTVSLPFNTNSSIDFA